MSTASAINIITRSMRLARAIGKGEIPDDDEAQDGLDALNAMLDSWQIRSLYVYQTRTEQFTWDANDQTQTVGAAGDFATDLPTRVADDCSFTINGIDYPVKLIDIDAWTAIPDKTTTSSFPWWIYVEYGSSLVTLYAYPIPNANITFNLRTWKRLQQFTSLTDVLDLPPGNRRAITYNLACEYAPEFGLEVTDEVARIAKTSRDNLKRVNSVPTRVMQTEAGYMSRRYTSFIQGDIT